ncbi:hypothetical protein BBJ28_00011905 [Nothophytophthora sp. Chile5]|nr:hypothetical protein BBJ28_00011905 [Nothophytophthora sp. Chile5]
MEGTSSPWTVQHSRWTPRDWVCMALGVLVAVAVAMCFWVAARYDSTAQRQMNAILSAVESASAIEFRLTLLQYHGSSARANATGHLHPRTSEDSGKLRFDGRVILETFASNTTEELVLVNHRGSRRGVEATRCLTTQEIPPLHTLEAAARSVFKPHTASTFGALNCSKPLEFLFFDDPFVICAEEWLRAHQQVQAGVSRDLVQSPDARSGRGEDGRSPLLVIHGKAALLEATLLPKTNTPVNASFPYEVSIAAAGLDEPVNATSVSACCDEREVLGRRKQVAPPSMETVSLETTTASDAGGSAESERSVHDVPKDPVRRKWPCVLVAVLVGALLVLIGLVVLLAHDRHSDREVGLAADSTEKSGGVKTPQANQSNGEPKAELAGWLAQLANASELYVEADSSGLSLSGMLFPRNGSEATMSFDAAVVIESVLNEPPSRKYVALADGKGYEWLTMPLNLEESVVISGCLQAKHLPPFDELALITQTANWTVDGRQNKDEIQVTFAGESYAISKEQTEDSWEEDESSDCWLVNGNDTELRICIPDFDDLLLELEIADVFQSISECPDLAASNASDPDVYAEIPLPLRKWYASYRPRSRRTQALGTGTQSTSVESTLVASSSNVTAARNCSHGVKKCLFVHGFDVKEDVGLVDSYESYWGRQLLVALPCCSITKFVHFNTVDDPWFSPRLSRKVCAAAVAVATNQMLNMTALNSSLDSAKAAKAARKNRQNLKDIAVIAHSSGNLNVASALLHGDCSLDANSSEWLAIEGPMLGTNTANKMEEACGKPLHSHWDDAVRRAMASAGFCPATNATKALVLQHSNASDSCLDSLYDKAATKFRTHVNASLCGVDPEGILSPSSVLYSTLAKLSNHSSDANDGVVEFSSCRGGLPASKYQPTYKSAFYEAQLNHDDGRLKRPVHSLFVWTMTKKDGAVCIYPGCGMLMSTQTFKTHFQRKHLASEEPFTTQHRDNFERARDDLSNLETPAGIRAYLSSTLGTIHGRLLKREELLDRVGTRLVELETAVGHVERGVVRLEATGTRVDRDLVLIDAGTTRFSTGLAQLEAVGGRLDTGLAHWTAAGERVDRGVARFEAAEDRVTHRLAQMDATERPVDHHITELAAFAQETNQRLTHLDDVVTRLHLMVASLQSSTGAYVRGRSRSPSPPSRSRSRSRSRGRPRYRDHGRGRGRGRRRLQERG